LVGACVGDSDTRCLGCPIGQHVVNNVCVDCGDGYTSSGGGACVPVAAGSYRGACTTDSNCREAGQVCCMGTCGDSSYCSGKCGGVLIWDNATKSCKTTAEVWAAAPSNRAPRPIPTGSLEDGPCSVASDCDQSYEAMRCWYGSCKPEPAAYSD
jgi:hypothetical protein